MFLQILIGNRCTVDKAANLTCGACSLLIDTTTARPTLTALVSHLVAHLPHPLGINCHRLDLLGLRTNSLMRSRWLRMSTVVKRSLIVGPPVYCTV